MPTLLSIPTPGDFSLSRAVCSYGFFQLAPNRWDGHRLHRPLRTSRGNVVRATIGMRGDRLSLRCEPAVSRDAHEALRRQARRMLRVDERFDGWYRVHRKARREQFARMFRSPTLFEDIVKTMTCCNVAWAGTKRMNARLCEVFGRDGAFPTPAELARVTPATLKKKCGVGYRAERIIRLAREVHAGRLDMHGFEQPGLSSDELCDALRAIYGVGEYAAHNLLQLLGRYDRLPIDTETIRHFRQIHGMRGETDAIAAAAREHYDHFAPYQFLAYWYELWRAYERTEGADSHAWSAER